MKILALETTDRTGGVALLEGSQLLAETRLDTARRSAQTLAPAIRDLLTEHGWRPADVRLIAVAVGPGSFTGLRIGVTTAKTLAYALGAELLGVNTLEVIAAQAPSGVGRLAVAMDAQRQQVFAGQFTVPGDGLPQWLGEAALVDDEAWLASLEPGTSASGPALVKLAERLPAGVQLIDESLWSPRAATVGRLALAHSAAGRRDDPWQLVPLYLRRSAAEEKADANP